MTRLAWIPVWLMILFLIIPADAQMRIQNPPKPLPETTQSSMDLAKGNNDFAFDLYQKLSEENLCFSPISIYSAFGMAYAGARGETETEMRNLFRFHPSSINEDFNLLIEEIERKGENRPFFLANSLWTSQGDDFLPAFLETAEDYFHAEVEELKFKRSRRSARKINKWVSEATHGKIKDLVEASNLKRNTKMMLVNAVYLNAKWASPFEKAQTTPQSFFSAKGEIQADFMHKTARYGYFENEEMQLLELPYKEGMSMIVLLPSAKDGLEKLEKRLTTGNFQQWMGSLSEEQVKVHFPKFEFEQETDLDETLQTMGLKLPFSSENADLSGINGRDDLYISEASHKALIRVDEEGTEAAASTSVTIMTKSINANVKEFRADHPFIYMIRSQENDMILFMGRVGNPNP